jgi:hypothetical protein
MTPQRPSDIESPVSPGKTDRAAVVEHRPAEGGLLAMLEGRVMMRTAIWIILAALLLTHINQLRHDPPDGIITAARWPLDLHVKKA